MSDFAVFECTAVLPKENVSKFKNLFYHEGKDRREKNFGVAANWSEEDIADNLTRVTFDCQNGQGIYFGWYKTEVDGMNMEGHCRKLQAHGLVAINEWQSPKTADEYWLYLHGEIMLCRNAILIRQCNLMYTTEWIMWQNKSNRTGQWRCK